MNSDISQVKDFVTRSKGHTVITKILLANNGMAAVKAIRSIRKWSYETFGTERMIQFTAMSTPEDLKMNAEYILMADHFIQVPGGSSHNNYSNVDLIVDIAERIQADAVWVGWGFASENPVLAERLGQLNPKVIFIGPPPSAMRALGDKIASTIVAQSAKVPCVDWSGAGLEFHTSMNGIATVPDDLYQKATITTLEEGLSHALRIGFPVMIKASEGGGGKGIRLVYTEKNFGPAFVQVQREVPGSPIFVMQVVQNARHLEVQLLGDSYGNAIALFGRDCSVQRRHQKIIEEAPVSVAPPSVLRSMEQSAVNLAKLVGYTSAGTVEYLYEPSTQKYYFLELNPRLQVEHPTTEMVTGVNLPAAQLLVAMGIPLSNIKDIRLLYGLPPSETTPIDFDFSDPRSIQIQRRPAPKGHVIATRITAENPEAGFKPNSGKVLELNFKSNSNVWGYFSVNASGGVHEFADSQFGHLFAYGESREDARKSLIMALKEISIRGDFRTTVEYLVKLLEAPTFEKNEFTTSWLDQLIAGNSEKEWDENAHEDIVPAICGAFAKTYAMFQSNTDYYISMLQKGKVSTEEFLATKFTQNFIMNNIQYKMEIRVNSNENFTIVVNGGSLSASVKKLADGGILILFGGKSHVVYLKEDAAATTLMVDGSTFLMESENDPTQLKSPSPGKLIRYMVQDGDHISPGDSYAEIEVMKMYMPLVTKEGGIFTSLKPISSVLSTGDVIGSLQLDDPGSVKKPTEYDGLLPVFEAIVAEEERPHHRMQRLSASVQAIMAGFEPESDIEMLVSQFIESINNVAIVNYEFREALGSISSRIPSTLANYLYENSKISKDYLVSMDILAIEAKIAEVINGLPVDEKDGMTEILAPLLAIINRYRHGVPANARKILLNLLSDYSGLETRFQNSTAPRVLLNAKDLHMSELEVVMDLARGVAKTSGRTELILHLLDHVQKKNSPAEQEQFLDVLNSLTRLTSKYSAKVAFRAREILLSYSLPSIQRRREAILSVFSKVSKNSPDGKRIYFDFSQLSRLITSRHPILDILPDLFFHQEYHLRAIALYTYVMRTNQAYTVTSFEHHFIEKSVIFSWEFDLLDENFYRTQGASESIFDDSPKNRKVRKGIMFMSETLEDILGHVKDILPEIDFPIKDSEDESFYCYVTVALKSIPELDTDEKASSVLEKFIMKYLNFLKKRMIQRVTFMVQRENAQSRYFTFRASRDYKEDPVLRHIEPYMAHLLELGRMSNFDLKSFDVEARGIRLYHGTSKQNSSDTRFFIRGIIHPTNSNTFHDFMISEGTRIMTDILDTLELFAMSHPNTDCNHILLHFIPIFSLDLEQVGKFFEKLVRENLHRLSKLRITDVEICYMGNVADKRAVVPHRFIVEIKSPFFIEINSYVQEKDSDGTFRLKAATDKVGPQHNELVYKVHAPKLAIQPKRNQAHLLGTSYAYDFPALFQESLKLEWKRANLPSPEFPVDWTELALNASGELEETKRAPGYNDCGMIVFRMTMLTPEYPKGRQVIIILNDITFQMGSFGPKEDLVFLRGSQLARKLGVPRIYISANSGARIGLADEIMSSFKIAWKDENEKQKGFDYLYLDAEDYLALNKDKKKPSVTAVPVSVKATIRYKLTSVIGHKHGLGVENLHGSGEIAGETSLAYRDIFTITLVTCRSVGIGAYLVRLGQRVVQVEYSPIILTGAGALNKVLGRQVYQSNLQLGGTRIMHTNGVSHLKVQNDFDGVTEIIKWLAYVPSTNKSPLPIVNPTDPVSRSVNVSIPTGPYDPRTLLEGENVNGEWLGGFFDNGSFIETLSGWANGVVVGRGRLGGIPMGCICVETRTTETIVFADPAVETSQEETIKEAGQVWYPNSAFKTAQAIRDFNNGEQLPLIIFANWRGFSGGQSDMYKEVLKFGAQIVDALTEYKQPIFVYVIGELRGGAWVVVDPSINPDMMEMYCSENSRGGVLEPQGIVEIKYRTPRIIAAMERLDEHYSSLRKTVSGLPQSEKERISQKIADEEKKLIPIFEQAAVELADLHDRPERMLAKGVVKSVVEWSNSRQYFYGRLIRRIREDDLVKEIKSIYPAKEYSVCRNMVIEWFKQDYPFIPYDNDKVFMDWLNLKSRDIKENVFTLRNQKIQQDLVELGRSYPAAFLDAFKTLSTQFDFDLDSLRK